MKIITDTSALYTIAQGKELGVDVIPLCININDTQLRDLECDTNAFIQEVREGHVPSSSQPPIGEVIELYEQCPDEEILHICMADGLSGTYQTALSAQDHVDHKEKIHVINSKTLCGPHRYLVEKAVKLRNQKLQLQEIMTQLQESMDDMHSFLIPQDFDFLKRGGRLKGAAATLGGLLKLKPIMEQVDEGTRLDKFTVSRTLSKAASVIKEYMEEHLKDQNYKIYISHADALEGAQMIMKKLKERFNECEFELLELSPAFITQGGPECIAVQYIRK